MYFIYCFKAPEELVKTAIQFNTAHIVLELFLIYNSL